MNAVHRLCLIHGPSVRAAEWCGLATERALQRGWAIVDAASCPPQAELDKHCLILSQDLETVDPWGPTTWVNLSGPHEMTNAPSDEGSYDVRFKVVEESRRRARISELATRGNLIIAREESDSIELPLLGALQRSASVPSLTPAKGPDRISPLAVYDDATAPIGAEAFWRPTLFTYTTKTAMEGGHPSIDLTGRSRALMYGPYIYLPTGMWRAEVKLAVDPEGSSAALRFEWGAGDSFITADVEVTRAGSYTITLDQRWHELDQAQLRLWSMRPLFQGRVEFQGVRVIRLPDDARVTKSSV